MYIIANFVVQPRTRPMYNKNWAENCKTKQPTKKLKENHGRRENMMVQNMSIIFLYLYMD
jgi:hypothetical protein